MALHISMAKKLVSSNDHVYHPLYSTVTQSSLFSVQISFADYAAFEVLDAMVTLSATSLDNFPLLKAFHSRVAQRSGLQAYLKSAERTGLKINGNGNQ